MNEYNVSDYGIFGSAISTVNNLNTKIENGKTSVAECKTTLSNPAVFMGPICDSCISALTTADSKLSTITSNLTTITNYLKETSANYQAGDDKASSLITGLNGSKTISNVSTDNSSRDEIYNFLADQGFNKAAICGILANIRAESNYRSTATGDHGTSYGLCQWHKGRWDNLKSFCDSNGLDSTTTNAQLQFLMYELTNKYPKLYESLKNVSNNPEGAYQAAFDWTVKFERPAGMEKSGDKRGNNAKSQIWEIYKNV